MKRFKGIFAGTTTFALNRPIITAFQLAIRSYYLHVSKRNIKNTIVANLNPGDHSAWRILMALRLKNISDNKLAFIRKMME